MRIIVQKAFTKPVFDYEGNSFCCFCKKEDIPKVADALNIRIKGIHKNEKN